MKRRSQEREQSANRRVVQRTLYRNLVAASAAGFPRGSIEASIEFLAFCERTIGRPLVEWEHVTPKMVRAHG